MLLDRFAILISAPVNRFAAVRKALTVDERWSIPRRLVAALLCTLLTLIPALASAQGAVAAEKLTVLIVPLVPQGENPAPAQQLAGSIGAGLQQSGRYTVKEPPGSHATCPDEACAVQAGKSLGVAKVVAVRVNEVQANVWHASAQLMDVSTGAVEATDVADHTGTLPGLLTVQSAAMVDRLTTRVADPAVPRATAAVAAEPPPSPQASQAPNVKKPDPVALVALALVLVAVAVIDNKDKDNNECKTRSRRPGFHIGTIGLSW